MKPIDEPTKPIRACADATLVPKPDPPHQGLICHHRDGSVTPMPDPVPKRGGEGVVDVEGRRERRRRRSLAAIWIHCAA